MSEKPLKAYHVGEGSEGEHVIVFATSGAAGRRQGGNELNLEFEEVQFCRRAPWADEFAGQRFIPAKAYHDNGWWLFCNHCETRLYEDAEDDDSNRRELVYDGQHAYCDQGCKDAHEQDIANANAKGEAFKAKALQERPYLTFTKWNIGWPRITQSAEYTFPGGKYGGSVRDEGDGQLNWYIAQADQEAWNAFRAQQAA